MFLNKTVFKRLVKAAYNNGRLAVGDIYGGILIDGKIWRIWCAEGHMPNWAKAALVELIGEFPGVGQLLEYKKNEVPQICLSENEDLNLPAMYRRAETPYTVTQVTYGEKYFKLRFLQNRKTKELAALSEELYSLIDFSNLEPEENRPAGPSTFDGNRFFWKNEQYILALYGMRTTDEKTLEVMSQLGKIVFEEDALWEFQS